ncbi:excisionase family DNA-binding protein [Actinomadura sp. 21ATH]|uniref:excisionase family DNA-binding protein n=1 Tax=Actinomadura sp. 21ATH TaxID=1735444 RepID=UPI0035C0DD1A
MTDRRRTTPDLDPNDRLLTYDQAAQILNTSPRFPRRLVEERRILFVRVGRFNRIPESALRESSLRPVLLSRSRRGASGGLPDGQEASVRTGPQASLGPLPGSLPGA